jgi:hypothetical protein
MPVVNLSDTFQGINEEIDKIASRAKIDYIDAVLEYCRKYDVDEETIGEIISKNPDLKEKVKADAAKLNMLKQLK